MSEFDPWRATAQNIGNILLQTPMLKQQAQEGRLRGTLYQQQALKEQQERTLMENKGRMLTSIEQNAPQAMLDVQNGALDTPAVRSVIGATSGLSGEHPETVAEAFGRMIMMGRAGKDPTAMFSSTFGKPVNETQAVTGDQWDTLQTGRNSRNTENNQTRRQIAQETPVVVGQNDVMLNRQTGQTMGIGSVILNPGQNAFGNTGTNSAPIAQGQPKITTASPGSYVYSGTNQIASVPNAKLNEVPFELREIIRSIQNDPNDLDGDSRIQRIQKAIQDYNSGLVGGSAPTARRAMIPGELVNAVNPKGQKVRIKQSQLQQAIQQGYKSAQ